MQKFLRGQRVKVADDLGPSMSHFRGAGCEAIVIGSYSDLCAGMGTDAVNGRYALHVLGDYPGYSSWYDECQLTLINPDRDEGERIIQQHKANVIAEYHAESDAISANIEAKRGAP